MRGIGKFSVPVGGGSHTVLVEGGRIGLLHHDLGEEVRKVEVWGRAECPCVLFALLLEYESWAAGLDDESWLVGHVAVRRALKISDERLWVRERRRVYGTLGEDLWRARWKLAGGVLSPDKREGRNMEYKVDCYGEEHRIVVGEDRHIHLTNHDLRAELAQMVLTKQRPCACVAVGLLLEYFSQPVEEDPSFWGRNKDLLVEVFPDGEFDFKDYDPIRDDCLRRWGNRRNMVLDG